MLAIQHLLCTPSSAFPFSFDLIVHNFESAKSFQKISSQRLAQRSVKQNQLFVSKHWVISLLELKEIERLILKRSSILQFTFE